MAKDKNVQYLCAKIRGHWLGVDVDEIEEIATPGIRGMSKLDGRGETLKYRGEDIRAIYLPEILLGDTIRYLTSSRVLVSRDAANKVGIIVDSAEEIIRTTRDKLQSAVDLETPLNKGMLEGVINLEDRTISILSMRNLVDFNSVRGEK